MSGVLQPAPGGVSGDTNNPLANLQMAGLDYQGPPIDMPSRPSLFETLQQIRADQPTLFPNIRTDYSYRSKVAASPWNETEYFVLLRAATAEENQLACYRDGALVWNYKPSSLITDDIPTTHKKRTNFTLATVDGVNYIFFLLQRESSPYRFQLIRIRASDGDVTVGTMGQTTSSHSADNNLETLRWIAGDKFGLMQIGDGTSSSENLFYEFDPRTCDYTGTTYDWFPNDTKPTDYDRYVHIKGDAYIETDTRSVWVKKLNHSYLQPFGGNALGYEKFIFSVAETHTFWLTASTTMPQCDTHIYVELNMSLTGNGEAMGFHVYMPANKEWWYNIARYRCGLMSGFMPPAWEDL